MKVIFTERSTNVLYEVQLFDDFVLVRPAGDNSGVGLEKLTFPAFTDRFDEFWGDQTKLLAEPDEPDIQVS